VTKFDNLGTRVANKNCFQEESKAGQIRRIFAKMQRLLSLHLLSKYSRINIHKTTVLLAFYGYGTRSVTLREDIDSGCLAGCWEKIWT
jgi:hypothetical protein